MKRKTVKFRGTTFIQGKKVNDGTKRYPGFFFNKYTDAEDNETHWFFVRTERNWITNDWIEYYVDISNVKNIDSFYDSVDAEPTFVDESGFNQKSIFYEASTLKNTLENL